MEAGIPDRGGEFADEGTAAHFLASECLEGEHDAKFFLGRQIAVCVSGSYWNGDIPEGEGDLGRLFHVDADMCREVQKYIDAVREAAQGGELHVEQRLPIFGEEFRYPALDENGEPVLDENGDPILDDGQFGTSDAVILGNTWLHVIDLKFGRGVQVFAEENEQLMLYALGALDEFDLLGTIVDVTVSVNQPRLNHSDSWTTTVEHLRAFEQRAIAAGKLALSIIDNVDFGEGDVPLADLNPGPDQCRFCKAKATCPALRDQVLATVAGDFDDIDAHSAILPPTNKVEQLIALGKGEIAVSIIDAEKIIAAAHGVAPGNVDFDGGDELQMGARAVQFIVKKPTLRPMLENPEARLASASDEQLGLLGEAIDLVEGWAKAVRAELERRMLAGGAVPGFKLVKGREGIRKFSNPAEAEAMMKSMRLKQDVMYDWTLISPTTAEKLYADGIIGKKQWPKLQALIVRSEAGLSVAPAADKRPAVAITPVADDFEALIDEAVENIANTDDLSDLI